MWNNPWTFWSYRRKHLDIDLEEVKGNMRGIALDVGGGRRRGIFKEPKNATWIVLDMKEEFKPTILGDANCLPFKGDCFDCVKCTELLEHVEHPEMVIKEMARILKPAGVLILSMPFNIPIHADPYDFQRFTDYKLKKMLKSAFKIRVMKKQGLFFTVLGNMLKQGIINMTSSTKHLFYLLFPFLDLLVKFDDFGFVKNSEYLRSFTTGFFIVAKKIPQNERRNAEGGGK